MDRISAATLYITWLASEENGPSLVGTKPIADAVYAQVANRLAQLLDDVRSVGVDRDERARIADH